MESDIQRYVQLFADGDYFEAHEVLEDRWRVSRSPCLQGLIQIAAGYYHLSRGNLHGARSLLVKAARYLEHGEADPEPGVDPRRVRMWLEETIQRLPDGRRHTGPLPSGLLPPAHFPLSARP